jgi:tRNA A-37 threonylcarbamoyl transferase component Bud32
MSSPPDETSLAETGLQSSGAAPASGASGHGASRPGWLSSSGGSAPHDALSPGTLLAERYRILGLAGRGGMGEVYRAEDLRLGQSVALKFLPGAVAGDPQRLAQFHHEVRIARQVSHRNVCRVYDIGEDHGRVFLTMELVDGEDLALLLKRIGRFPEERATEIARQICAGLAAAHECGVLHRDLKPANIMLDAEGRVRITDFGLAGLAGKDVTERSDLFSLGLVLFEIFTGKRAFDATTIAELLRQHDEGVRVGSGSTAREMDPAVQRVIERCLAREPAERPTSAIAVSAALPGGDPLAAALAAGETPSPAMVAAAGRMDAVPLRVGLGLVAAVLVGLAVLIGLRGRAAFDRYVPAEMSGPVLEYRARQAMARLGYGETPRDAFGALMVGGDYLAWARRRAGADRWKELGSGRTPGFGYWYRTSPEALVPIEDGTRLRPFDPPQAIEGMTLVHVDAKGFVSEFYRVPPQRARPEAAAASAAAVPIDWQVVFDVVGWPRERFTEAKPEWTPLLVTDTRVAWTGTMPALGDTPLRLEAAAFAGKIVYIQAIGPWTRAGRVASPPPSGGQGYLRTFQSMIVGVLFVGSALLARRNVLAGRGDHRSAWRLALVVGVLDVLRWLCIAHFSGDYAIDQGEFLDVVAESLLDAGLAWLAYLGIEPWLRRHWPTSLISWSRLLGGGRRDPLVGRDLLIGIAFGVVIAIYVVLSRDLVAVITGQPPGPIFNGVALLTSLRWVAAGVLGSASNSLMNGILLSMLYVVLRQLVRHSLLAAALSMVILALLISSDDWRSDTWHGFAIALGMAALLLLPLLRFGLLPFTVSWLTNSVLQGNVLTSNLDAWYAPPTYLIGGGLAALALFAFVQSRAGAPLFGRLLED